MTCDYLDPYTYICALSKIRCVNTPKEQCKPKFSKNESKQETTK